MCHEFLTHPLLFFSLCRLCFSAFLGFVFSLCRLCFQPLPALFSAFVGFVFPAFFGFAFSLLSAVLICFFYTLHEVIPKVVASAVSTLIAICRIVFQVSFFILFSFKGLIMNELAVYAAILVRRRGRDYFNS